MDPHHTNRLIPRWLSNTLTFQRGNWKSPRFPLGKYTNLYTAIVDLFCLATCLPKILVVHDDPNVTMLFICTPEKYHANKETNLLKMYLLLKMVMFNPAMLFSRGCNNLHPQILHPFCYLQCTLDGTTTFKLPTRSLTSGSRLPSIIPNRVALWSWNRMSLKGTPPSHLKTKI